MKKLEFIVDGRRLTELHEWIFQRRQKTKDWNLPENTIMFLKGMEEDLVYLSKQLGIDLCIMTIKSIPNT